VFQVKYMSSVGKWTKKAKSNLTVLANDRSTPAIVRLVNVRQAPVNVRWANDRTRPANMRTWVALKPAGALDNLNATPSLLFEVGN
jgi:hypothetical protein